MKKTDRFMTFAAALVLCISVLCAVFFLSSHIHHHCTGDECTVCAVLIQCEQRMQGAALANAAGKLMCYAALCFICMCIYAACETVSDTLVSLKVELLN